MTASTLKSTIKKQINNVQNETILLSIHAMLKEVLKNTEDDSLLTNEQKSLLDKTLIEHKSGKLKYFTVQQAKSLLYKKG